jgi:heme oxygenase
MMAAIHLDCSTRHLISTGHGEGQAWNDLGIALRAVLRVKEARRAWEQAVAAFVDTRDEGLTRRVRGWIDGRADSGG